MSGYNGNGWVCLLTSLVGDVLLVFGCKGHGKPGLVWLESGCKGRKQRFVGLATLLGVMAAAGLARGLLGAGAITDCHWFFLIGPWE